MNNVSQVLVLRCILFKRRDEEVGLDSWTTNVSELVRIVDKRVLVMTKTKLMTLLMCVVMVTKKSNLTLCAVRFPRR